MLLKADQEDIKSEGWGAGIDIKGSHIWGIGWNDGGAVVIGVLAGFFAQTDFPGQEQGLADA